MDMLWQGWVHIHKSNTQLVSLGHLGANTTKIQHSQKKTQIITTEHIGQNTTKSNQTHPKYNISQSKTHRVYGTNDLCGLCLVVGADKKTNTS